MLLNSDDLDKDDLLIFIGKSSYSTKIKMITRLLINGFQDHDLRSLKLAAKCSAHLSEAIWSDLLEMSSEVKKNK